jgi:hypothetical protein
VTSDDPTPRRINRWRPWLVALVLVVAAVSAATFMRSRRRAVRWPDPVSAENAMGDSTCLSCHTDKASYESTAHRLSTRHPTSQSMQASFHAGDSVLRTPSPKLHFIMRADSSGYYETAVMGTPPDTTTRTERVAYVAGSGRKGQSFLYWKGDRLFQMPVSYWTALHTWINSPGPGYTDGQANFERAVAPRCLECHATWMQAVPELTEVNRFDSTGAILGITCERCHASGKEHVARERSLLHAVRGPYAVNPARMGRERKMEACAQCHGGLGTPVAPSFTYVAGKRLDDYLARPPKASDAVVDVHGNQVALLQRSRCYQASQMTCLTCHDVHRTQRNTVELSGRCLTCHTEQSCGLYPKQGHALVGRCVDCHMPQQPSSLIVSSREGKQERALVRSHWIKVYRDSLSSGHAGR